MITQVGIPGSYKAVVRAVTKLKNAELFQRLRYSLPTNLIAGPALAVNAHC
jgi:hypothetical protein